MRGHCILHVKGIIYTWLVPYAIVSGNLLLKVEEYSLKWMYAYERLKDSA